MPSSLQFSSIVTPRNFSFNFTLFFFLCLLFFFFSFFFLFLGPNTIALDASLGPDEVLSAALEACEVGSDYFSHFICYNFLSCIYSFFFSFHYFLFSLLPFFTTFFLHISCSSADSPFN